MTESANGVAKGGDASILRVADDDELRAGHLPMMTNLFGDFCIPVVLFFCFFLIVEIYPEWRGYEFILVHVEGLPACNPSKLQSTTTNAARKAQNDTILGDWLHTTYPLGSSTDTAATFNVVVRVTGIVWTTAPPLPVPL